MMWLNSSSMPWEPCTGSETSAGPAGRLTGVSCYGSGPICSGAQGPHFGRSAMVDGSVVSSGPGSPISTPGYRWCHGPAEGGVKKIRGRGNVKGRKRHSGKRVTKRSNLVRDTGRLAREAGADQRLSGSVRITMNTLTPYARRQQDLRPFLFYEEPADAEAFLEIAREEYTNAVAKHTRRYGA